MRARHAVDAIFARHEDAGELNDYSRASIERAGSDSSGSIR